jgi:hypothetical protein
MTTFFSYNALISQRASGYRNTTYALAELIDNSFDATATTVRIVLLDRREGGKKHVDEVLICDDGTGMSKDILQGALQFGNTTNKDLDAIVAQRKKGKFGYGLPNASLSQCPSIHVFTWQQNGPIHSTYLDLKELGQTESIEIPPVKQVALPKDFEKVGAQLSAKSGTIVAWRKCDRLSNTRSETITSKSVPVLGRLFRQLIANGKKIVFSRYEYNASKQTYVQTGAEEVVRPNDPLFLTPNTAISDALWEDVSKNWNASQPEFDPARYLKPFSISPLECRPTNIKLEDHCYTYSFPWRGKNYVFELVTSLAAADVQKPGVREAGAHTATGRFYGEKAKEGNITFVRSGREISSGSYGFYLQTEPRHRWWTIEIRFTPDADDLIGVHNNKQGIEFSYMDDLDPAEDWNDATAELLQAKEKLWAELTKRIDAALSAAWKIVRKQHKEWDLKHIKPKSDGGANVLPTGTQLTTTTQIEVDGERPSKFTPDQRKLLLERLKAKYPDISEAELDKAIENFDQSKVRGCVLYSESESEQLWSYTTVYDFLIILINTRHSFYEFALAPLRRAHQDPALASIELFISSLAWEEFNHFGRGQEKDIIENFRSYVGLHLNKYMKELKIDENQFIRPVSAKEEEEAAV